MAFAQSLQWYQSVIGYPLITGGKPLNSTEAFVPISFETTILYAAFGAIAGMLLLNGLPRLYHPVFRGRTFARATNDGFFLTVEAARPEIRSDTRPAWCSRSWVGQESSCWMNEVMPMRWVFLGVFALAAVVVSQMGTRGTVSDRRPIIFVTDMDVQPRYDAQAAGPFFRDGRAMRTPPAGPSRSAGPIMTATRARPGRTPTSSRTMTATTGASKGQAWVAQNPLKLDMALLRRGQERYDIYLHPLPRRDRHG